MKDGTKIVVGLLILVAVIFLIYPQLGDDGVTAPTLAVAPLGEELMDIPTDVPCTTNQECLDKATAEGAPADLDIRCEDQFCIISVPEIQIAEGSE